MISMPAMKACLFKEQQPGKETQKEILNAMHRKRSTIEHMEIDGHCARRDSCTCQHDVNNTGTGRRRRSRSQFKTRRHSQGDGRKRRHQRKRTQRYKSVRKVKPTGRRSTMNLDDCTLKKELRHMAMAKNESRLTPEKGAKNDKRHQDVRGMKPEILDGHLLACVSSLPLFLVSVTALCHIACRTAHAQQLKKKQLGLHSLPERAIWRSVGSSR